MTLELHYLTSCECEDGDVFVVPRPADFASSEFPLVISLYRFVGLEGHQPKYAELCQIQLCSGRQRGKNCYLRLCVFLRRPADSQKSQKAVGNSRFVFDRLGGLFCAAV